MDAIKYRKWYLSENWGENRFTMLEFLVELTQLQFRENNRIMTVDFQRNHPMVLSGKAYWITHNKLCIGYKMTSNPEIYRPIFSHKRQRLLDKVNLTVIKPYKFWNKIKSEYFMSLAKIHSKKIPIECINHIVMFTY